MHIVRDLKIANSDFELLKAIGGECAGALSLLPLDHEVNTTSSYKKLSDEELKRILQRKGGFYNFTLPEDRPRLSLAGVQDKCPIFFDGEHYFLPQDSSVSTHILKFEVAGFRHIPAYECFLTKLAQAIKLPVVECQFKKYANEHFLLSKRYDRIVNDKEQVQRLHQEDFCQALGVSYHLKYEQNGGPSFQACYRLIQTTSIQPIADTENILKWQIFNMLAGNSDGHAKNLALLYNKEQQIKLAPFYDLVCTRAIERIDTRLALSVGGEFNPDKITFNQWKQLAKECDINPQYLKKLIQQVAEILPACLEKTKEQFEDENGPYPALQRVQKIIITQCKRTLRDLQVI